jgi:tetratricopeptide (TPR) repeat protein
MNKIYGKLIILLGFLPLAVHGQSLAGSDKSRYEFAVEKYGQGKYAQAVDYCTEIISGGTKNREVYKLRAMAWRALSNYENAASDYLEAIQRGRNDPQLFVDVAMVHFCQKAFDKAEQEINEAVLLLREQLPKERNSFIEEEMGLVNHYQGNYREAIDNFKDAAENGSTMAGVELLGSLFRANDFSTLRYYSDSLLRNNRLNPDGILSDSCLYYYVHSLNEICANGPGPKSEDYINRSLTTFRVPDGRCFQGFYFDLLAVKAFVLTRIGKDSSALETYKKIYAANSWQADVKASIDYLKGKLNYDVVPPSIVIKNPIIDANNLVTFNVSQANYEMYGQATDSSGIASVLVNNVPVNKIEDDGLFVFNLLLQEGANEVVVTAVDKNDNRSERRFTINNSKGVALPANDLADMPELTQHANYYAILIAESDYQDEKFEDLTNPVKDVAELKEILVKKYTFEPKNVMVLNNVGRLSLLDSLQDKCNNLTEEDNLLIYYAGHGTVRKVGNAFVDAFLIPSDAKKDKWNTFINSNDLKESIKLTNAKHVLLVVDACFGGALFRSALDDAPQSIKNTYQYASRRFLTSGNLEPVPDNGKFVQNLKIFLTSNPNKFVTTLDLVQYIKKNAEIGTPQFERIDGTGDAGGDFVFIRR